jgi:hypothetical protein
MCVDTIKEVARLLLQSNFIDIEIFFTLFLEIIHMPICHPSKATNEDNFLRQAESSQKVQPE